MKITTDEHRGTDGVEILWAIISADVLFKIGNYILAFFTGESFNLLDDIGAILRDVSTIYKKEKILSKPRKEKFKVKKRMRLHRGNKIAVIKKFYHFSIA